MLDVTDFTAFNGCTSCDIDLHVSGIKNPNYNNGVETGSFRIGFRTGRHFN